MLDKREKKVERSVGKEKVMKQRNVGFTNRFRQILQKSSNREYTGSMGGAKWENGGRAKEEKG